MIEHYKLLESKSPFLKMKVLGKIKRLFKSYEEDIWEPTDRNLIRGIFIRKLKDFKMSMKINSEAWLCTKDLKQTLGNP